MSSSLWSFPEPNVHTTELESLIFDTSLALIACALAKLMIGIANFLRMRQGQIAQTVPKKNYFFPHFLILPLIICPPPVLLSPTPRRTCPPYLRAPVFPSFFTTVSCACPNCLFGLPTLHFPLPKVTAILNSLGNKCSLGKNPNHM